MFIKYVERARVRGLSVEGLCSHGVCVCVCACVVPGEDEAVQVDPLALGYPGGPVQPLCRLQHVPVELLDELLLRGHVQTLLLKVVSQGVDVWLDHLSHSKDTQTRGWRRGTRDTAPTSIHIYI